MTDSSSPAHGDFSLLHPVKHYFRGLGIRWWIAGGWAVDLFIGRRLRDHDDVDVLVLDQDVEVLRAEHDAGHLTRFHQRSEAPWRQGQDLVPGPDTLAVRADLVGGLKVELVLGMTEGRDWVYHRGATPRRVRRPLDQLGLVGPAGMSYLCPEIVLRFLARAPSEKGEVAFGVVASRLARPQREWLRASLEPGHRWLSGLAS